MTSSSTIRFCLGSLLLLAASLLATPAAPTVFARSTTAGPSNEFSVYHVVGAAADEVSVPPALEPLRKSLVTKTNRKAFQMLGAVVKVELEVGKAQTVTIPGKLGKVQFTIDDEGKVEVVMFGADDKRQGAIASRVFPVVWLNDKIKTQGGDYILVLDRKKTD